MASSHREISNPFIQSISKNLSSSDEKKRKQAAVEIDTHIKGLNQRGDTVEIGEIIKTLANSFAYSPQNSTKKGGLLGMAAVAIGLMGNTNRYLDQLLPPVLKCFADNESKTRFAACEALYNVAKVARASTIPWFNEIFDGLCKLNTDQDVDVKNAAHLLNTLMKEIVTESDSEAFDMARFLPMLKERLQHSNPFGE